MKKIFLLTLIVLSIFQIYPQNKSKKDKFYYEGLKWRISIEEVQKITGAIIDEYGDLTKNIEYDSYYVEVMFGFREKKLTAINYSYRLKNLNDKDVMDLFFQKESELDKKYGKTDLNIEWADGVVQTTNQELFYTLMEEGKILSIISEHQILDGLLSSSVIFDEGHILFTQQYVDIAPF